MSIARRFLLTLLVLCLPLQSTFALAGVPCRSMPATTSTAAMPMMAGQHDHAAMMAAQDKASHHQDQQSSNHPMGSCEHCAHCPACSLSTGINAVFTQPIFHTVTPNTPRATEALASLVLDTPQRPPQAA